MDNCRFWRSKLGGRHLEYEIKYKIDELSIYLVGKGRLFSKQNKK